MPGAGSLRHLPAHCLSRDRSRAYSVVCRRSAIAWCGQRRQVLGFFHQSHPAAKRPRSPDFRRNGLVRSGGTKIELARTIFAARSHSTSTAVAGTARRRRGTANAQSHRRWRRDRVPQGATVLRRASCGEEIPRFCYHERRRSPATADCLRGRAGPPSAGELRFARRRRPAIRTDTAMVKKAREG